MQYHRRLSLADPEGGARVSLYHRWHDYCILVGVKLAIPVWNRRVAPVFDSAARVMILDVRRDRWIDRREVELDEDDPAAKVRFLRDEGVRELICGAISRDIEMLALGQGIRVFAFVAGDVEAVIQAWLSRQLDKGVYSMPGCRCGGRRHRGGRGQQGL